MTTDTPQTTAAEPQLYNNVGGWVRADFARQLERELSASKAEVERLGKLLYETRSLLTEFFDCVDIGGLHDGDCNISTEDPEKWDLGCNCTPAELRKKYIQLYSK
jgi:hypothetical protein